MPQTKTPTRSPTHEDVDLSRLSAMGLELEELAEDSAVELSAVIELAEDRGRPASHYLAALPLSDLVLRSEGNSIRVRVCAGTCQRWGALDILEALVERTGIDVVPVSCLDRCDQAASCEIDGPHGKLVLDAATPASVAEALDELA